MRLLRGPQLQAQRAPVLFLNVFGQSNGSSYGVENVTPPAGTATPTATWIWSPTAAEFQPYQAGVNADPKGEVPTAWGSELAFVRSLRDAGDMRPVYIHKWAAGGQSLAVGWNPSGGAQFNAWAGQRPAVRAAMPWPRQEVVLMNQGEADSRVEYAAAYESTLDAFIAAHRAMDVDGLGALWIIERIRPYTGNLSNFPLTSNYTVRAAQEKARERVRVIDLDFEPGGFNGLHPGSTWVIGKGERGYAAWANNITASDTAPSNLASIADVTGASAGATVTSNEIAIAGIDRSAVVTITGGEYRVRNSDDSLWQDWTSSPGTIHPFHKLTLRTTAGSSGSVNVVLTVGGVSETWSVTTASSSLSISGTPSSTATVGQAYTFTPTTTGGTSPYTYTMNAGTLPAGLSLNASTGQISGTPTTAATASGLVLRVTDNVGATADLGPFSITVAAAALVTWDATVNNPTGAPNTVYSNDNRTASTSANTIAARTVRNPVASGVTTGKHYARVTITGAATAGRSFGLILLAPPPGAGTLGTSRWSWGGTSIGSNSTARTMPVNITTVNGDYEIAVDVGANLFWMRQAGVGANWNNSASADPATGVDGLSCSARGTAALFLMGSLPNTTAAFSITIVSGTPPSGYQQWGGGAPATGSVYESGVYESGVYE